MLESSNLAPGLLLAMPQLDDPNFSRAVVLMVEHNEQGSFGLVINHPSPIRATELLESLEMSWRGAESAVVWAGGPVSPSTGWVLHEPHELAPLGQGTMAYRICDAATGQLEAGEVDIHTMRARQPWHE